MLHFLGKGVATAEDDVPEEEEVSEDESGDLARPTGIGGRDTIAVGFDSGETNCNSWLLETAFPSCSHRPGTNNNLSLSMSSRTPCLFIHGFPSIISCCKGAISMGHVLSRWPLTIKAGRMKCVIGFLDNLPSYPLSGFGVESGRGSIPSFSQISGIIASFITVCAPVHPQSTSESSNTCLRLPDASVLVALNARRANGSFGVSARHTSPLTVSLEEATRFPNRQWSRPHHCQNRSLFPIRGRVRLYHRYSSGPGIVASYGRVIHNASIAPRPRLSL